MTSLKTQGGGTNRPKWKISKALAVAAALALVPAGTALADTANEGATLIPVIVEAGSEGNASNMVSSKAPNAAQRALHVVGGVAVSLPPQAISALQATGAIVMPDVPVAFQSGGTAGTCPGPTDASTPTGEFPVATGADQLAAAGDTGLGATVAVLDTGINGSLPDFAGRLVGGVDLTGGGSPFTDQYGHGTFVAGLIAGNGASSGGTYAGEAPGANLVSIKVAGASGRTSTSAILAGINWAITNKSRYNISVLNLSLGAIPTGPTFAEPMDLAVEAAWRAGITVVVAAGNSGPTAGTILSPGDDPMVITTGAFADNTSPSPTDWSGCAFSSEGPTAFDGWQKPDLTAPGRSVVSLLDPGSTIATQNPQAVVGSANFVGSGTSFASAVTAGAVALVLADNPGLAPDAVKGRLLGNAMPDDTGNPFVEGHGFLNAFAAATGPAVNYSQSGVFSAEVHDFFSQSGSPAYAWASSSWNPSNWSGSAWTGGAPWNGSAWTGQNWNGSAWTGSAWTGSAWTGSAWTGSAWTGSAWTGSAWTGSAWTGSAWTGSAWTGSAWTGSAWTGSAWTGSAWTGSAWTGSAWTGSAWTGSAWTGSAWTGSAWTGDAWS